MNQKHWDDDITNGNERGYLEDLEEDFLETDFLTRVFLVVGLDLGAACLVITFLAGVLTSTLVLTLVAWRPTRSRR